jgi:hypothetical protein
MEETDNEIVPKYETPQMWPKKAPKFGGNHANCFVVTLNFIGD